LNQPAAQKEIRLITDMGLTGWDEFSISSLKQYDPSIPLKTIRIGRKQQPLNATVKEIRLGGPGIGVNLPLNIDATVINFGDQEVRELLVQLSIDGETKEQKLTSIQPRGETSVTFQTRLAQPGTHVGQLTLKKAGLAGSPVAYFTLDAQDKLKILVVDGDPQTSLVQSETFFLTRALNPAGDQNSSLYLPTVIIPDGLSAAPLDSYQVVILCNVSALPDAVVAKLQNFVRSGGGLLIFSGDRLQMDNYNLKLVQSSLPLLPAQIREKKLGPEAAGDRVAKLDLTHPALQGISDALLQESLKSARFWGYSLASASGKSALITLDNGAPLLLEQKVGNGRVLFMATSADRDWNDLPVKTAFLPLIQSLTNYLAGGKRGSLDSGIPVGSPKEILLPPSAVGKTLSITKPGKEVMEVPLVAEKERAAATIEQNDRAGIYRLNLPAAGDQGISPPRAYAVNPPFLESRLAEISERELQDKLKPIRVEVVPVDALQQGGKRMDLALPLLVVLIVTLLLEGWVAQRI
jgi:hypothetical protein